MTWFEYFRKIRFKLKLLWWNHLQILLQRKNKCTWTHTSTNKHTDLIQHFIERGSPRIYNFTLLSRLTPQCTATFIRLILCGRWQLHIETVLANLWGKAHKSAFSSLIFMCSLCDCVEEHRTHILILFSRCCLIRIALLLFVDVFYPRGHWIEFLWLPRMQKNRFVLF